MDVIIFARCFNPRKSLLAAHASGAALLPLGQPQRFATDAFRFRSAPTVAPIGGKSSRKVMARARYIETATALGQNKALAAAARSKLLQQRVSMPSRERDGVIVFNCEPGKAPSGWTGFKEAIAFPAATCPGGAAWPGLVSAVGCCG